MKREIEYHYPEYTLLVEITDTNIFDKTISFDDYHSVFIAKNTRTGGSVVLAVSRVWEGLRYKQYLYYLSSVEGEEEDRVEHEWYCEGELSND